MNTEETGASADRITDHELHADAQAEADDPGIVFMLCEQDKLHNCVGLATARLLQPALHHGRNINCTRITK